MGLNPKEKKRSHRKEGRSATFSSTITPGGEGEEKKEEYLRPSGAGNAMGKKPKKKKPTIISGRPFILIDKRKAGLPGVNFPFLFFTAERGEGRKGFGE